MDSRRLRRYILLPIVYALVIVAIIFVQFFGGNRFSATVGPLLVTGSQSRGSGGPRLESIIVNYNGIEFLLSKDSLQADSERLSPVSWSKEGASTVLVGFTKGVSLRFYAKPEPNEGLRVEASDSGARASSLRISYRIAGSTRVDKRIGLIVTTQSKGDYVVSPDSESQIDIEKKYLSFSLTRNEYSPFNLSKMGEDKGNVRQYLALLPRDPASFQKDVTTYLDKAIDGWAAGRFSESNGWMGIDGNYAFSENAVLAYVSEALYRGIYPQAMEKLSALVSANKGALGYLGAPYFGNMVKNFGKKADADALAINEVMAQIDKKDPALFERSGLLYLMLDRASKKNANSFLAFVAAFDGSGLSLKGALGFIECYVAAKAILPDASDPFLKHDDIAERYLLPAVVKLDSGYYLSNGDGNVGLYDQLRAGLSLLDFGAATGKSGIVALGQLLVDSAVALSDSMGILPANLPISGRALGSPSGAILPENFYSLFAARFNPYYPHEVSFYSSIGQGVWAWTCAKSLVVDESNLVRTRFSLDFPLGRSHFLYVQGIGKVATMQLNRISGYMTDPAFETYDASGWLYQAETSSLLVKIKHKNTTEQVLVSY